MGIILNIIGGIIAGFFAAGVYEWIRRPRLDITLIPHMALTAQNGSWVATRRVRVRNREVHRFLKRFVRRSDAHSCYAWVVLYTAPLFAGVSGPSVSFGQANWIRLYQPPSSGPSKADMWITSHETAEEFINIGAGGAAEIAIARKATGDSACFVAPWGGELQIGKYVLKVEVGCSGLPHIAKWFLLENKGTATDPQTLADSFVLEELKEKEVRKYLPASKDSAKSS